MVFHFFADVFNNKKAFIYNKEDIFHIKNVIRTKENNIIKLVCGKYYYKAVLSKIHLDKIEFDLIEEIKIELKKYALALCFGINKGKKNDLIIEKCTETGIDEFIPLICDNIYKKNFNIDRAKKITRAASKQCCRMNIPKIYEPMKLCDVLIKVKNEGKGIYFQPNKKIINNIENSEKIFLFIGSESGFSNSEINMFKVNNIQVSGLGNNILRAETAAIASSVLFMLSDR